jgi:hypothetical protein
VVNTLAYDGTESFTVVESFVTQVPEMTMKANPKLFIWAQNDLGTIS